MIRRRPAFDRAYAGLDAAAQAAINRAVFRLPEVFGRPHLHSGLGIRPVGRFYELRLGLNVRVIFLFHRGDFWLCYVGNHGQIARWIRGA